MAPHKPRAGPIHRKNRRASAHPAKNSRRTDPLLQARLETVSAPRRRQTPVLPERSFQTVLIKTKIAAIGRPIHHRYIIRHRRSAVEHFFGSRAVRGFRQRARLSIRPTRIANVLPVWRPHGPGLASRTERQPRPTPPDAGKTHRSVALEFRSPLFASTRVPSGDIFAE